GTPGTDGVTGPTGATGTPGTDGVTGPTGHTGPVEINSLQVKSGSGTVSAEMSWTTVAGGNNGGSAISLNNDNKGFTLAPNKTYYIVINMAGSASPQPVVQFMLDNNLVDDVGGASLTTAQAFGASVVFKTGPSSSTFVVKMQHAFTSSGAHMSILAMG
ncbi:collagen-like triple helix repeat-containing protein, partial [Bacillus sp. AF62]